MALPETHRDTGHDFRHHAPEPVHREGAVIRVFLGSLAGEDLFGPGLPPLLGAATVPGPYATTTLTTGPAFEHGLLAGRWAGPELGYLGPGSHAVTLADETDAPARAVL